MSIPLTPAQTKERLRISLRANVPCFIQGMPAIGKSSIVKQLCEEEGLYLIDVRLSQLTRFDLLGLPKTLDDGTGNMCSTYVPFDIFPLEGMEVPQGYKGFCIFFNFGASIQ